MSEKLKSLLMREGTGISWADLTMNFWIGCQEVSQACNNCYAREFTNARLNAARAHAGLPPVEWGPGGARQLTSEQNRRKPIRWNRVARDAGAVLNVFCSSLSDWADNAVPDSWRQQIALTMRDTPNLRWMMLTKRVGNVHTMLQAMFPDGVPENFCLGITVANQQEADRDVPKARWVKAELGIQRLFLSIEPMLGPVDLSGLMFGEEECPNWDGGPPMDPETGMQECCSGCDYSGIISIPEVDLVIVGGESGRDARPMHPDWARGLRDQCAKANVLFHFKQWSEWAPGENASRAVSRTERTADWENGQWQFSSITPAQSVELHRDDEPLLFRIGVKAAGHLLDGKQHREHFKC